MAENLRNWAGNYEYRAERVHHPTRVEEVQEIVRAASKVKALGTRHSFNDIADTEHDLVSMEGFSEVLSLAADSVTVQAGIPYGKLARYLHQKGYAIHNLASLPHISVAGACATATHGSGDRNGNLATAVRALQIVTADGEKLTLERGRDDAFNGAVVNLGALGIVTEMTLDILPSFDVKQSVYEGLPLAVVAEHFDEITSAAYSVSLFTDWRLPTFNQVWLKSLGDDFDRRNEFFGATLATADRHPIPGVSAENCSSQMGIAGPWHERLPHFKMDFTPSNGEELQSEYLVPREKAIQALHEVAGLRELIAPLLHISEVRTIAADDLWMSPCYRQPCVGIHFTWKQDWESVRQLLPLLEERLLPLGARPHWGKLFMATSEQVRAAYPRLPNFLELCNILDKTGKFINDYVRLKIH